MCWSAMEYNTSDVDQLENDSARGHVCSRWFSKNYLNKSLDIFKNSDNCVNSFVFHSYLTVVWLVLMGAGSEMNGHCFLSSLSSIAFYHT